jgi:hypothetical protein
MASKCKCHGLYDDGHDWWRCDVHGRVTKSEYEEEYDTTPPPTKKARPGTTSKTTEPTKKARPKSPEPKSDDGDDGDEGDGAPPTNEPPDKPEPKDGEKSGDDGKKAGPSHGMSRGFWGD